MSASNAVVSRNASARFVAAEAAGLMGVSRGCSDILREETAMALWRKDPIPPIARMCFERTANASG